MDPFARGGGQDRAPSGGGGDGETESRDWGRPAPDETADAPAGWEPEAAPEQDPGGQRPATPGGLGDPPPEWSHPYSSTPAEFPPAPPPPSESGSPDPAGPAYPPYQPPAYDFPFYGAAPPPRRGSRAAMVAVAIVACVTLLALGIAGGAGAVFYLRHQVNPIAGRRAGLPNQRGTGAVDLHSLAARLDPSIVDITGVKKDATGQTVENDAGTGVIISTDGDVLTNNHVIEGDVQLKAELSDGRSFPLQVLGEDPTQDVALVQMEGVSDLPTIRLHSGARASVREVVAAFGNALGKGGTPAASQGHVTNLDQTITATLDGGGNRSETLRGLIEMSAQICPGDSGGMLVDSVGQYLGILTAASTSGGGRGQGPGYGNRPGNGGPGHGGPGSGGGSGQNECSDDGFVIPAARAIPIVKQIQSGRRTSNVIIGVPGFLGVEVQECTDSSAQQGSCQAPPVDGAEITQLIAGGAAQQAGLPESFVITAIDQTPVSSPRDLTSALQRTTPGQVVQVTWNDGQGGPSRTTTVTLGAGPPA